MLTRLHHRLHWRGPGRDLTIDGWVSRLYDRLWAGWLLRGFYRRVAHEAGALVPPGGTVLDVGTGPGMFLVELAHRRGDLRITGVDLSSDMVAIAERNVRDAGQSDRVEVRLADVASLPFADASFDLVVATFSAHHWGALAPAVGELTRVLRPGGELWIYDVRTLPDDVLAAAVAEALGDQPLQRRPPRGSRVPWPLYARWTATRPALAATATITDAGS
ncbi:MAG: class I SAM-dependent methyltransferase [Actinomycetota bacterium]|nr:class I SAM-dependent methyltransferase [Actinomycetota bacterium]